MKEVTYDAVLDRERAFIWFDYFSIDQDDSRVKSLGIQSLIHYTTNCTAMLIPTPHAEVMAFYPEKLPVYGKRAWYGKREDEELGATSHPAPPTAGAAQNFSSSRSTPRWSAATSGSTRRRPTGCSASFRT